MDISVLVELAADTEVFRRQLASLDAQSLPSDAYEVLVDGRTAAAETREVAQRLAAHRPNVRVLSPDAGEDLLLSAEGVYVLSLAATDTLFPSALERLRDAAEGHDLDAVIGRTVEGMQPVSATLWSDHVIEGAADDAAGDVVLVRRSAATRSISGQLTVAAETGRVGVQTAYPTSRRTPTDAVATPPAADRVIAVDDVGWSQGRLELSITASGADLPTGEPHSVALLRHTGSQDTRLVPAPVSVDGAADSPVWRIHVTVDPLDVTSPLSDGVWQLLLQLGDPDVNADAAVVAVPWAACPAAVLAQVPVVPASLQGRFALDVGAVAHPLVSATDPTLASVTESATGSLLVLPLTRLHVVDTDTVEGFIAQDKMQVPARIVVDGDQARLEAYVSGPKSLAVLSARFGSGRLQPTGLSLEIGGEGAMRLVKTKPPAPPRKPVPPAKPKPAAAKPKPAVAKKKAKPKPKPRQGVAAQLRRAVPKPLEPAVRRLAHNDLARRVYRRITR
ncbi:MAG: hypothetical protein ABWY56_11285 [Propionibacteriaceae bacterium]